MSTESHIAAGLIEEYKSLREEMMLYLSFQNGLIGLTFTVCVAIFAFAVNSNNFHLLVIVYAILIPVTCRQRFYCDMQFKLGTYIRNVIEPQIEGLNWESAAHYSTPEDSKIVNNTFAMLHNYLYSVVGSVASMIIGVDLLVDINATIGSIIIFTLSVILSCLLYLLEKSAFERCKEIQIFYHAQWSKLFPKL